MMRLLEIALVDEMDKAPDLTHCNLALLMVRWTCYHLLPVVLVVMSLITTLNVVLLVVRFDFFYDVASWPTGTADILFMCLRRCQLLKAGQLLTWSAVNV